MKVVVFGASGQTGRQVVEQALQAGHEVTAFVRERSRLDRQHERLRVVEGDVYDAEAVARAIAGQDAVISVLGQTRGRPSGKDVLTVAAGNIVAAMQRHGVRRLITLVGAGVADPQDRPSLPGRIMVALLKLLSGDVLRDAERHVEIIRNSDLDWTVVRVPRLSNAPPRGRYRVGFQRPGFEALSRADLADFLVKQLTDNTYLHRLPIVSY